MKLTSLVVAGLVAGLVLSACGDDGGGGSLKQQLIDELCGAQDECCQAKNKPNSVSACQKLYALFTADATTNETKANACLAQIRAARASGEFCTKDDDEVAPDCDGALEDGGGASGTKQPGEPCESSSECARPAGATGVTCVHSFTSAPTGGGSTEETYCEVTLPKAPGEKCGDLEKGYEGECDEAAGAYCDFSTDVCVLPKGEGEECSFGSSQSCQKGLYCASAEGVYVCTKRVAAGGACDPFSNACDDATYCADDKTCTARLPDGTACTSSETCLSNTCVNKVCGASSAGSLECITD